MRQYEDVLGYSILTHEQKKLLERTHQRHQKIWESEERKAEHSIDQMKEVKWDNKENCLKVYYKTGWYHYMPNGDWY